MNFKIRNFGKITEADIKLDGITVICGKNNTGKSTVGKALFLFFNSLYDYKNKIFHEKIDTIRQFVLRYTAVHGIKNYNDFTSVISSHEGKYTVNEVKDIIETFFPVKITKEKIGDLTDYLNLPETDILNEYVFRFFNNIMNGQVKRTGSGKSKCTVIAEFKTGVNNINFTAKKCTCSQEEPLSNRAYYINNPFVIDYLNNNFSLFGMSPMERNVIDAIKYAQAAINENSMSGILESVTNKKDLEEVEKILKQAYIGDTVISNGMYYYSEDGEDFDIRNISAGLKAFALIERLLETGVLKRKDVLILDEPEIHLHSQWQIIYAELIVILQKKFDLTILLVTHSFHFLESLDFFMKKYEISERGNYYIPNKAEKGVVMQSCGNDASELKRLLATGSVTLSDLKFKFEMENYHEEDN